MKRTYQKPDIQSEKTFETEALACGKNSSPPPGTWHFGSAYDTFTGHLGSGFGGSESVSGSASALVPAAPPSRIPSTGSAAGGSRMPVPDAVELQTSLS